MALKQYNPTSPGRRFMTTLDFDGLAKKRPERALTEPLKKSGGRNSKGRITIWFRGGGHKRHYRVIDFRRDKRDVPAKVAALEAGRYDVWITGRRDKRQLVQTIDLTGYRAGDVVPVRIRFAGFDKPADRQKSADDSEERIRKAQEAAAQRKH